jgi:hypothetical protein
VLVLLLLLVALAESRTVLSEAGEVVVAEVWPFGSSSSAACKLVTTLLGEDLGLENSRVSVTMEVAVVGRGVLGGAITVGVERGAWLEFSVAIVGVDAGTGVPMVAWSVPSVATVGLLAMTGVPRVAWSVPSVAIAGVLATTSVPRVA